MTAPDAPVVHLIGPGGAGKTTVGPGLASRLGWRFIDQDHQFIAREGDVATYIATHGYAGYARRNVAIYLEEIGTLQTPAVFALSSGFMTYPATTGPLYAGICRSIEHGALTALLLPAFELEACVEIIVRRQLGRPYLPGNRVSEEARIRDRFPIFMALQCARFDSSNTPDQVASQIEGIVREWGTRFEASYPGRVRRPPVLPSA